MPTDRGLAIIGFEIIDWSCVKRNEKRETVASTADSWLPVHATGMLPACSRTCSGAATCNVREHRASPHTANHKRQTSGNHNHNRNRKPHADRMQHGGRGGGMRARARVGAVPPAWQSKGDGGSGGNAECRMQNAEYASLV